MIYISFHTINPWLSNHNFFSLVHNLDRLLPLHLILVPKRVLSDSLSFQIMYSLTNINLIVVLSILSVYVSLVQVDYYRMCILPVLKKLLPNNGLELKVNAFIPLELVI